VRKRSATPLLECLTIHHLDPARNKIRAAKQKWCPKCPLPARNTREFEQSFGRSTGFGSHHNIIILMNESGTTMVPKKGNKINSNLGLHAPATSGIKHETMTNAFDGVGVVK
jgi:hypothetical protein